MKTVLLDPQKSLVQWVSQATGINSIGVKVRLLGNDLHILCEAKECPKRWRILSDLLQALQKTDLDGFINEGQPSIYQVLVYGRKKGEYRPEWCHRVYLNQLDRHLEQVQEGLLTDSSPSNQPGGALIISNETLARQGNPDAIARYLSENLSNLGVAVKVKVNSQSTDDRLWIICQSSYNPDASLLAEPIAQKLRDLKLSGYQDAVIISQVGGEIEPDWLLRIDLTPPEVMLKEWARWGDVEAIAKLLTDILTRINVCVQANLKESTLHIFCTPSPAADSAVIPDEKTCLQFIIPQLEAIAPQGILATAIYGQKTDIKQPVWINWSSLPASQHPALAIPTLTLAAEGDEPALIFLLERLLNSNMDWRLRTGGIRVLLLRKGELLHIMCDSPLCPTRQQVTSKVTEFIRQLNISGIVGVRVYGRRAGDKKPIWHHGVDFRQRNLLVLESTPEFVATNAIAPPENSDPILRYEFTTQIVPNLLTEIPPNWLVTTTNKLRNLFLESQLFTETNLSIEQNPDEPIFWGSMVWIALGLLFILQTDWMLGYVITQGKPNLPKISHSSNSEQKQPQTTFLNQTEKSPSSLIKNSAFNGSDFTKGTLPAAPLQGKATATAILLAARSPMPTFNSRQLDEQLALYKQRLAISGKPPDVLIIGSSRALRGVDPVALSKALATKGYPKISVFNFGINGATAQVVDFVIRQVLEVEELPKIILWADGSRAFNEGREDITFNAIAASPGYKQALQKVKAAPTTPKLDTQKQQPEKPNIINIYESTNEWLNQGLANLSVTYQHRDQIKNLFRKQLNSLPLSARHQHTIPKTTQTNDPETDNSPIAVDFDGFLPLSIRFDPATYYQNHPKVSGSYDNDYKSFQLTGKQDQAFQSVLEFTESKNIDLVFVNTPLTQTYLDPIRRKYEQEFQQYMLKSSTNTNLIYRDLSEIWLTSNYYFSDPSHLNRYGAYEVSKKLAVDPMIPWGIK
ncbi:DUF1574 domain-containing protein [Cronbergia sp. UHCC 0137]|uniref:DUF1574 domain-containing protein n=1 Tax=Cronbergia sp. UHCC 0137 TaxID=3110239 RepID=UPI002B20B02F|nr:DUF1574 domain-containing protein [Cronbergia sp. UHCC 0137]MEA5617724.1 DUF1574 domain-containing protein [Cronbergia sp. UHCC 0137]